MSKPTFWTCACGSRETWWGPGTPKCGECGKLATFSVNAPKEQGKLFQGQ